MGFNSINGYSLWRVDSSGYFKPGVASLLDIGTAALPVRTMYVGTVTATTLTGAVVATTVAPTSYIAPAGKTKAQLAALTPTAEGQLYFCSDCIGAVKLSVSTGTTRGAFGIITSSVTFPS